MAAELRPTSYAHPLVRHFYVAPPPVLGLAYRQREPPPCKRCGEPWEARVHIVAVRDF